jgi:hypothetical protein
MRFSHGSTGIAFSAFDLGRYSPKLQALLKSRLSHFFGGVGARKGVTAECGFAALLRSDPELMFGVCLGVRGSAAHQYKSNCYRKSSHPTSHVVSMASLMDVTKVQSGKRRSIDQNIRNPNKSKFVFFPLISWHWKSQTHRVKLIG